jgi:hypothetical protein
MSVHIMIKFPGGTSDKLMAAIKRHSDTMVAIAKDSQSQGAAHQMFTEDDEGNVYVIDEWPSREAFDKFFSSQQDIPKIISEVGVTGEPVVMSYRILDTPDRF